MTRNKKLNYDLPMELPLPVLPEELVLEILLRLPVTSLLQIKCVSKSWKTLISCPQFAKTHLQISTAEPSLTHQQLLFPDAWDSNRIYSYPLKSLFENSLTRVERGSFTVMRKHHCFVVGSCNGLLCVCNSFPPHRVRLCNPSIKFKSKKSPKSPSLDWALTHYGFGYDQVNDKYKVLVVVHNTNHYLTKLYTFGEDCWETIPNFPCTPIKPSGKFVSGTLNWIVIKGGDNSNQNVILSFHLEKQTYREVLLPQSDGDFVYKDMNMHVLSDCLCVLNKIHWVVWLMKEYGIVESWTKLIIIPREKASVFVKPSFISENTVLLVNTLSSQLILYNLNSGGLDYPGFGLTYLP